MITAKEYLEDFYQSAKSVWSLPPVDPRWKKFAMEVMKEYTRLAIIEDRKNVVKYGEVTFNYYDWVIDENSIINAPQIELL